ncbi:hypothetical protein Cgig2_019036 [Carnegiea gigantea]|uniref:Uncharacterized protein n=1 Tax=Carnegiea gigantea TaxID=171969 RepID=A0A9Q1GXP5_9CARY|nr:hypothetical protein Cgig2_019036 [Carnegiea gigantea]
MVWYVYGPRTKKKKTTVAAEESRASEFMVFDGRKQKKGMKVGFHVHSKWELSEKEAGLGRSAYERRSLLRVLPMDFPHSLNTKALCPSFELVVVEEASEYYEPLELPQVIFYVMLLNKAERLRSLESALIKLPWSTFESWVWLYGDRIFEARFCPKFRSGESSGRGR